MKRLTRKKVALILVGIILVIVSLSYLYSRRTLTDKQQMESIRRAVSRHIILPTDEDPTLATVTDKKALKDAFLSANAETGDKVLVYYKSKLVYLYRPSAGKLVATGPLRIEASADEVLGARIRIRNGTTSDEQSNKIRELLEQNYKSATLQATDSSNRRDYPTTIVIDLTEGDKYNLVSNIASTIGAQRGVLPAGEAVPADTDILILTGVQ